MRQPSLSPIEKSSGVRRAVTTGLGVAALTLGVSAPAASAHSRHHHRHAAKHDCQPPKANITDPVAAGIKSDIVHGKAITFDGSGRMLWMATNGIEQQTTTQVTEVVNGQTEDFILGDTYTGGFSPRDLRIALSDVTVTRVPEPLGIFDDEVFPGHENATPGDQGVITVNTPGHVPSAEITFSDGSKGLEVIGFSAPATPDDLPAPAGS